MDVLFFRDVSSIRMRLWALAAVLVWSSSSACGGDSPDLCADTPTFTNDIRPTIIEEKCIQCHSESLMGALRNGAPEGMNFDTYASTMPFLSEFADEITAGREPPAPLSTTPDERDLVSKWRICDYPE